jgi:hypothetical protein
MDNMSESSEYIECKSRAAPTFVIAVLVSLAGLLLANQVWAPRHAFVPGHSYLVCAQFLGIFAGLIAITWSGLQDIVLRRDGILLRLALLGSPVRSFAWREIGEIRVSERSVIPFVPLTLRGLPRQRFLHVYVGGRLKGAVELWRQPEALTEFLQTINSGLTPTDWTYSALRSRRIKVWRRTDGQIRGEVPSPGSS